jgi:hypothetical protein
MHKIGQDGESSVVFAGGSLSPVRPGVRMAWAVRRWPGRLGARSVCQADGNLSLRRPLKAFAGELPPKAASFAGDVSFAERRG